MAPQPVLGEEEEEDDYMSMTFTDDPVTTTTSSTGKGSRAGGGAKTRQGPETSLQRRQRLKREAEIRGRPKSKAELKAEEEKSIEESLSTSLLEEQRAKKSKGFRMMEKMGFKAGEALGKKKAGVEEEDEAKHDDLEKKKWKEQQEDGKEQKSKGEKDDEAERKDKEKEKDDRLYEPLRPEFREGRGGIGLDSDRKRKVNEAYATHEKKARTDETEFRDRVRRERENGRLERLVQAAMKVCESMDNEEEKDGAGKERQGGAMDDGDDGEENEEKEGGENRRGNQGKDNNRLLKSIPVEYRGLVRRRLERERERRMRHDLEQSGISVGGINITSAMSASNGSGGMTRTAADEEDTQEGREGGTRRLRLPTYRPSDFEEDVYDVMALGRGDATTGLYNTVMEEDLHGGGGGGNDGTSADADATDPTTAQQPVEVNDDGEVDDEELAAFEALPPDEQLARLVAFLRTRHRYCFWCKYQYRDEEDLREGCPGETEEDHD